MRFVGEEESDETLSNAVKNHSMKTSHTKSQADLFISDPASKKRKFSLEDQIQC